MFVSASAILGGEREEMEDKKEEFQLKQQKCNSNLANINHT